MPEQIVSARKQGFSSPDASWFKGESIDYVKSVLMDRNSKIYNFFDRLEICKLADEHFRGVKNRRLLIWSLMYFENYLSHYS